MMLPLEAGGSVRATERLVAYLKLQGDPDSVVNRIVLDLATDIIEGRALPGQSVNSLDLAKRFATSRTPIREALIALAREGLLEIEPRKRPRIAAPSDEQIAEIYALRADLNALVATKVVHRLTDADLPRLQALLGAMRVACDAGDVDEYFWRNVDYHEVCEEIAGDSTLSRVLSGLGLQVLRLRHEGMSPPGQIDRSMADHERLQVAFAERDVDLAAALSRTLVLRGLRAIRRVNASLGLGSPQADAAD